MNRLETGESETSELEVKILSKRRELHNLVDRADAARRSLNYLYSDIDKERRKLTLLEKTLHIKVLVDKIKEDGKLEEMQKLDIDNLKDSFDKLGREDVNMLYEELQRKVQHTVREVLSI